VNDERRETPNKITAFFSDGPLKGKHMQTDVIQGRPPATVESTAPDGSTCRYCLAEWEQSGDSAVYSFLYAV
jgi:hypothetical protein